MRGDRGYSLLELLIALALIGFIAIAIGSGMRFGARAWERSDAKLDALVRVDGAQSLLRTLLGQAVPRALDPSIAGDPLLFRGTGERLQFSAVAPSAFAAKGIAQFVLSVEGGRDGKRLVLSWQGLNGPHEREVILSGAREVTLAYGALDQHGTIDWTADWTEQSGAPALVRVRASFADAATRWPDLIVRTRIMQDPECIYDADTFGCRHG